MKNIATNITFSIDLDSNLMSPELTGFQAINETVPSWDLSTLISIIDPAVSDNEKTTSDLIALYLETNESIIQTYSEHVLVGKSFNDIPLASKSLIDACLLFIDGKTLTVRLNKHEFSRLSRIIEHNFGLSRIEEKPAIVHRPLNTNEIASILNIRMLNAGLTTFIGLIFFTTLPSAAKHFLQSLHLISNKTGELTVLAQSSEELTMVELVVSCGLPLVVAIGITVMVYSLCVKIFDKSKLLRDSERKYLFAENKA